MTAAEPQPSRALPPSAVAGARSVPRRTGQPLRPEEARRRSLRRAMLWLAALSDGEPPAHSPVPVPPRGNP